MLFDASISLKVTQSSLKLTFSDANKAAQWKDFYASEKSDIFFWGDSDIDQGVKNSKIWVISVIFLGAFLKVWNIS